MTYREKLTEQFPLFVKECGISMFCPYQFGYEEKPEPDGDLCNMEMPCRDCWNREMPCQ